MHWCVQECMWVGGCVHVGVAEICLDSHGILYSRNRDTLPGMDAISVNTCHSSSGQLMFSMSLGDSWHVEGHCVDSVEPRNTAAEALLLVHVWEEGRGGVSPAVLPCYMYTYVHIVW